MGFDPFEFYRFFLSVLVCCYTVARLTTFIWRIQGFTIPTIRGTSLVRRYLLVHLLRIRWRRFIPDLVTIAALGAVLGLLVSLHFG